ncbi:enoyl-CoA hydratase/isomerase family protein [Thermodesulfobacteriota bacterium]
MAFETILLEKKKGIAVITLNRPERLNAFIPQMNDELKTAVEDVTGDGDVRVLVLTGAGRGFCAGADRNAQADRADMRDAGQRITKSRHDQVAPLSINTVLHKMEKPTICAVNGAAVAVGLSLALSCDIRIASETARFGTIWGRRGLMGDGGGTYYLTRLLGTSKALELLFTDDIIDAREAERIGLVSRVVPREDLMPTVKELAGKIAKGPSVAMELNKRAVYKALTNTLEAQLDFEHWGQSVCYATEDHKEAIQAAKEKRDPAFKGR